MADMTDPAENALLTVSEVAALLNAPERTVRYWATTKKLPSYPTPGGRHRFLRSDVEKWLPKETVA